MHRRTFLKAAVLAGTSFAFGGWPTVLRRAVAAGGPYGPLQVADANGFELPAGFSSRAVATTGQVVPGTSYAWHGSPDGGATFATSDGGWIYVSNSEISSGAGGAGMVRFGPDGSIVDARRILAGTSRNCAGGPTPWGTWLSCEETPTGMVWECDPAGVTTAGVARRAMGRFNHEAAAVDPGRGHVYLTEDMPDGGLYRFVPAAYPDLSAGTLEVMVQQGDALSWAPVPDPEGSVATRYQVAGTKVFNGGEGAWWDPRASKLWFTTKGDNRVWRYDPPTDQLAIAYDDSTSPTPVLTGVDNVTVAASGDAYVCEDGGNMEIVVLTTEGEVVPFARLTGVSGSEMTGVAFDPSGTRMYVSSQRSPGRTYEITGPFRPPPGGGTTTTAPPSPTTTTPSTTTTTAPAVALTATAYKVKGAQRVDLRWTGATTAGVVVTRDGVTVATTANDGFHTDAVNKKGGGTYTYRVCETGGGACSGPVTVTF